MGNYVGRPLRRKRHTRVVVLGTVLGGVLFLLSAAVRQHEEPVVVGEPSLVSAVSAVPLLPVAGVLHSGDPIGEPPGPPPSRPMGERWSGVVGATDTFYGLLTGRGIEPAKVLAMARGSKGEFDLTRLIAGQPYALTYLPALDSVEFRYRMDSDHDYVARLEAGRFSSETENVAWDMRLRHLTGTIRSSVFETLRSRGLGDAIPMKLAVIYAWDIEFAVDIRPGDTYNILFQEKWRDGKFVEYGKVLAATIHNRGEDHTAVYYKDASGFEDYYDPDGRSLCKQFLRSPVNYTRISSRFDRRRFHPILKRIRPHLGVDLAAPRGTPIRSVGTGRVIFAGRKGGSGNMVKIRHGDRYMTAYLHLSRFAKGIRRGAKVKQGQVIGYVGSTGLATGPHVCYRFYDHGRYVNPLTVKFPPARPVKEEYRREFVDLAEGYLARLAEGDDPAGSG